MNDDPKQTAMDNIMTMIRDRIDLDDGLEMLMRLNAGTVVLHVSKQEGATFLDTITGPKILVQDPSQ